MFPLSLISVHNAFYVFYVATTAGGEDVVKLKATVAELQQQLSTNDKTKEVCTMNASSYR